MIPYNRFAQPQGYMPPNQQPMPMAMNPSMAGHHPIQRMAFNNPSSMMPSSSVTYTGASNATHPFQRAQQHRSEPQSNKEYIPLSEIRRKQRADEAASQKKSFVGALQKDNVASDPTLKNILSSIGFDFELSMKTQEEARRARESAVSQMRPPQHQMTNMPVPAYPVPQAYPTGIPTGFPQPPPTYFQVPQVSMPNVGAYPRLPLQPMYAGVGVAPVPAGPVDAGSRSRDNRSRSPPRETYRDRSRSREERSRYHDDRGRSQRSQSPRAHDLYRDRVDEYERSRRSTSPYRSRRSADVEASRYPVAETDMREYRRAFDHYVSRLAAAYDTREQRERYSRMLADDTVEREYRRYRTRDDTESRPYNDDRMSDYREREDRSREREDQSRDRSRDMRHNRSERSHQDSETRAFSPFSSRIVKAKDSPNLGRRKRPYNNKKDADELYDDLSDGSISSTEDPASDRRPKFPRKDSSVTDESGLPDSGQKERRFVKLEEHKELNDDEIKEALQKRDDKEVELKKLLNEWEILRREENELMRKKRKEKDGHNDPEILENARKQHTLYEDIETKRHELRILRRNMRNVRPNDNDSFTPERKSEYGLPVEKTSDTVRTCYRDLGQYYCQECNIVSESLAKVFLHLRSPEHLKKHEKRSYPWTTDIPRVDKSTQFISGGPIKGVEFLLPSDAFFCELCQAFFGDKGEAEKHLKGRSHHEVYEKHIAKYPTYEKVLNERMKFELERKASEEARKRQRAAALEKEKQKKQLEDELNSKTQGTSVSTSVPPSEEKKKATAAIKVQKKPAKQVEPKQPAFKIDLKVGLPRKIMKKGGPNTAPKPTENNTNGDDATDASGTDSTAPSNSATVQKNEDSSRVNSTDEKEGRPSKISSPIPLDDFLVIPPMPIGPQLPAYLPQDADMEQEDGNKNDNADDLEGFEVLDECE